jgi:hypothetical protein
MEMDNKEWAALLGRLPTGIRFEGTRDTPAMTLSPLAVSKGNMQTDAAAFEAWALALLTYDGVRVVQIHWPELNLSGNENRHYARFMYRLNRFAELLGDRVSVDRPGLVEAHHSKLLARNPTLNVARSRDTSPNPSPKNPEAEAEKCFKRRDHPARPLLMVNAFRKLTRLCRQFPVGLFEGEPAGGRNDNAIFTGGRSAIDLIGVDENGEVWFFELKVGHNAGAGALSGLLFYAAVLLDARDSRPKTTVLIF